MYYQAEVRKERTSKKGQRELWFVFKYFRENFGEWLADNSERITGINIYTNPAACTLSEQQRYVTA